MVELRSCLGLGSESFNPLFALVLRKLQLLGSYKFERDDPIRSALEGAIDNPHTASGDLLD